LIKGKIEQTLQKKKKKTTEKNMLTHNYNYSWGRGGEWGRGCMCEHA
jgi:hypothetical protein